ncbi:hypothetical protein [Limnofasciculus baicalensis]|uniref:DUF11 domain-containing protein n=1 Tax=Limnofasciculus baicalensis BBK-W-15 TaxID=2699891 RepID=A0AAE3KMV9_9CYAN|nr:hypothetical protein [Limnofasciculus baicalensis]MCP2729900.1 hypothetical protein [Limnofasciculus baicalensis BBK-W-15]
MNYKISRQIIIHLRRYIFHQGNSKKWRLISLALTLLTWGYWSQPVRAEGTGQIILPGGNRFLTEWREDNSILNPPSNSSTAPLSFGIPRRTILQVYAKAGEIINVGSSAMGESGSPMDANRVGNGLIYRPGVNIDTNFGTDSINPATNPDVLMNCVQQRINLNDLTRGKITTRAQETAGPLPAAGGYNPCTYIATADGIYTVVFTGPRGRYREGEPSGIFPLSLAPTILNGTTQLTGVAGWDITVTANGNPVNGRVFTNYLAILAGAFQKVNTQIYVATKDGYQYRANMTDLDPDGAILFSNNRGFTKGNTAIYRSIDTADLNSGTSFQRPNLPDSGTDFTNKIFFNPPDPDAIAALASLGFASVPQGPLKFTNFQFLGCENTPNQMGTFIENGAPPDPDNPTCLSNYRGGGTFGFFNPNTTAKSYTLRIDIDGNGSYTDPKDVILLGTAPGSSNVTQFWDGKDGEGNPVPATTVPLKIDLRVNAGETHFPFLDVENSGGVSISLLNLPGTQALTYYNDSIFDNIPGPGKPPGIPNPDNLLNGADSSSTPVHIFTGGGNFGNNKGMDTWVFVPFPGLDTNPEISLIQADLAIEKTVSAGAIPPAKTIQVFPGDLITYTLTVKNNGPSDVPVATPANVVDTIDANIIGVNWTCTVPAAQGSCGATSGSGNAINTTVVLKNGATATYTITGTVSPTIAINTIPNTSQVLRGNDVTDPTDPNRIGAGNNTSNAVITVVVQPKVLKSVRWAEDTDGSGTPSIGDILEYTIRTNNPSPTLGIADTVVKDIIPAALQVLPGSVQVVNNSPNNPALTVAPNIPEFGTGDPNKPTILTTPGTLAAGGSATVTYRARIRPGAAGSLENQAVVNFNGDNGRPALSDAADTVTAPGGTGSSQNSGFPGPGGDVLQPAGVPGAFNPTIIKLFDFVTPTGTKSVRLASDLDGNGEVSKGDILEYTITYINSSLGAAVTDFIVTDKIDTALVEFAGGYSFTPNNGGTPPDPAVDIVTTVKGNPTFNGTTDVNLTNPINKGKIGAYRGEVIIKYQVKVIGPPDAQIVNQAQATSSAGTLPLSVTNAVSGPQEIPQVFPGDNVETGNVPTEPTDDEPTIVVIKGSGTPSFRLVKRITNILRNNTPLAGVNFGNVINDPNDVSDDSPLWSKLPPVGVFQLENDGGVLPGDLVEYTIYFLSDGTDTAKNIRICDAIPEGTVFEPDTFGASQGMKLRFGAGETNLTNNSDSDQGRFFSILEPATKPPCPSDTNPNGSILVNVGNIPAFAPNNTGFIRFRIRVND